MFNHYDQSGLVVDLLNTKPATGDLSAIQTFRSATLDTPYDGVNMSNDFVPYPQKTMGLGVDF